MPRPASALESPNVTFQKRDCDSVPPLTDLGHLDVHPSSPRRTADALAKGFGPYDHEHVKAAIIIQRTVRRKLAEKLAPVAPQQDAEEDMSLGARTGLR